MIFYHAKRNGKCVECKGEIGQSDFCVKQFIKSGSGQGYLLTFHYDCFIKATIEHIRIEASNYIAEHSDNKKSGRPTIYTDGKKADSLKHLIKYYSKQGSTTKVLELELELAGLIKH